MRAILRLVISLVITACGGWSLADTAQSTSAPPFSRWQGHWYAASPTALGFDSGRLSATISRIGEMEGIYGFLLVRGGYLVEERYWREATRGKPHNLKSASKSVISALVGIAIAEGYFRLDQPIAELLPQANVLADPAKKTITVRDVLTMRSGLKPASYQAYNQWVVSEDWVSALLRRPLMAPPGTLYQYSTGNTHLLSAILAATTGKTTRAFAEEKLFGPMNIQVRGWQTDPSGIHVGGNNLSLVPRDMAKFGQLFLDRGRWTGRQLVPEPWVEESTRRTDNGPHETYGNYGYLWWSEPTGPDSFAAVGYGGQYIVVSPRDDAVIVVTSTLESKGDRWEAELFDLLRNGVLGSLVDRSMPPALLAIAPGREAVTQVAEPVNGLLIANVNLRAAPTLLGRKLALVPRDSEVELLGRDGDWLRCRVAGRDGWIHRDYVDRLTLASEPTLVALADRPSGPPSAASAPGRDLERELAALIARLGKVREQVRALGAVVAAASTPPRFKTTGHVNFRRGPALGSDRLALLAPGTEFEMLDRSGPWLMARVAGEEGWVHSDYARALGSGAVAAQEGDLVADLARLVESVGEIVSRGVAAERADGALATALAEASDLKREREQERASKETLAAELERVRAESEGRQQRIAQLEAARNGRTAELEGAWSLVVDLKRELAELTTERARLQETLDFAEVKNTKLAGSLADVLAAKEALASDLELRRVEIERLVAQRESDAQARAQEIAKARARTDELERSIAEAGTSNESLAAALERQRGESRSQIERLVANELEQQRELVSTRRQVGELERALRAELGAKQALTSRLERLNEESEARRARIEGLEAAAASRTDELSAARTRIAELDRLRQQELASKRALANDLELLRSENDGQRDRLAQVEAMELEREQALVAARLQASELERALAEALESRQSLTLELDSVRQRASAAFEKSEAELAQSRSRAEALAAQLEEAESERVRLGERLAQAEQQVAVLATAGAERETELVQSISRAEVLAAQLGESESARAEVGERLVRAEQELAMLGTAGAEREAELAQSRSRAEALSAQLEESESVRAELGERLVRAEQQVAMLGTAGAEREAELAQSRSRAEALSAELGTLRAENESQLARLETVEQSGALKLAVANSSIADLHDQLERSEAERARLEGRRVGLERRVAELEDALQAGQAAKRALVSQLAESTSRRQALQTRVDQSAAVSEQTAAQLGAATRRIVELERGLEEAVASNLQLEGELGKALASRDSLAGEVERLTGESAGQREALAQLESLREAQADELEASRAQASELEGELGKALASRDSLAGEVERLTGESAGQREALAQLESSREAQADELEASRAQASELEGELGKALASRDSLAGEVERLTGESVGQREALARLESARDSLIGELSATRSANVDVQRQLATAVSEKSGALERLAGSNRQVTELERALEQERASKHALVAYLDRYRREGEGQLKRLRALEAERNALAQAHASAQSKVAELETDLAAAGVERLEVEERLVGAESRATSLQGLVQDQEGRLERLEASDEERARVLAFAQSRVDELRGELEQARGSRERLSRQAEDSKARYESQVSQLTQLAAERAESAAAAESRIASLEGDLARERAAGLELSAELARLRESSRSQSQEIARLEAERLDSAAMQTRVAELEGDLERERGAGLKLSAELAGLRESSRSQSQEIARLEAERLDSAAMQTRVAELEGDLERERGAGFELSAELAGLRESSRSQSQEIARLEAERLDSGAMQTRVAELEGDLERERAAGLKRSAELAGLRESSRSQSQEIARLEAERLDSAAMQTRVAELEDELERERAVGLKRSAELAGLRESNRSQSEELARLEAERLDSAAMQSRVSELETQIDQVQQAEGRAVRELGRAGQRITDLEQTLARERTVKQDLLNEMQQNEQALLRQSTERGELASRLEERTANLDRARQELAELSGQLEGVTRDLTGRIETSARAREADRASLAQSFQRIERLEAQVDTGARGIEALEAQLRAVEQERDRARGRRDELESELQAQQAALASARADVQALREVQTASKLTVEELARIQARVGELEKQLGESESERAGLDQELLALRAADRDRAVLAASHERLAVELAEARARIESLEEPPAGGAPEKLAAAGPSADVGPAPILKPGAPPRLEPAVIAPLPDVGEFVQAWADAWSRKDVGGYLASYSSRFRPADGSSRPAWERVRRQRLTKPKYIEVTVTELRTELIGRDRARATFRQAYRADHYRDSVSKTLLLVLEDGEWRIAEENSR